jgi:DNA-binding XRE family transcriptional regulator
MKNEERDKARNLFFETGLTQGQIAALVGISEKTLSHWSSEEGWKRLRQLARQAPLVMTDELYNEVSELNEAIRSREPGKRFANMAEAEVRRKTLLSIKYIKEQQSPQANIEVLTNFTSFVNQRNVQDAKTLVTHADRYLKGELKIGRQGLPEYHVLPDPGPTHTPDNESRADGPSTPDNSTGSGDAPEGKAA